ncbi:hypothetical protein ACFYUR_18685 [Micromonospora haikouensis]|uniref:hypothetical protein n=1 Tax=Micromonospora haikouensis TaxID=686309 RepID=UPI003676DB41
MTVRQKFDLGDLVEVTYVEDGIRRTYRGVVLEVDERLVIQVTYGGNGPVGAGWHVAPYNHAGDVSVIKVSC